MKAHCTRHRAGGFTLIELLCVIALVSVIAALLLSALNKAQARARRIQCISDLKQVGLASHVFALDHGGRFPMQVPVNDGGSREFLQAAYQMSGDFYFSYRHFQALSNELIDPKLVVCPADTRLPAASFALLNNSNLSYFVAAYARLGESDSILAGDRNLTNDLSTPQSLLRLGPTNSLFWTWDLHRFKGNVLFADGHVEEMNNIGLVFTTNEFAAGAVLLPTVKSDGPPAGAPPGGGPGGRATAPSPAVPPPVYTMMQTQIPVQPKLPLVLTPRRGADAGASGQASPAAPRPAAAPEISTSAGGATAATVVGAAQTNPVMTAAPVQKSESLGWLLWLLLLVMLLWLLVWLSLWFRRRE
jgi:prepilin-type N-terminal cleavage/methylation domain-containing protein/prepilin-type processing-associated H-X9-DG protein